MDCTILFIAVGAVCVIYLVFNCCCRRQQSKRLEELLKEILEGNKIVHIHVYNFQMDREVDSYLEEHSFTKFKDDWSTNKNTINRFNPIHKYNINPLAIPQPFLR